MNVLFVLPTVSRRKREELQLEASISDALHPDLALEATSSQPHAHSRPARFTLLDTLLHLEIGRRQRIILIYLFLATHESGGSPVWFPSRMVLFSRSSCCAFLHRTGSETRHTHRKTLVGATLPHFLSTALGCLCDRRAVLCDPLHKFASCFPFASNFTKTHNLC